MSSSTTTRPNSQLFSPLGSDTSNYNFDDSHQRFSTITSGSVSSPTQPVFGSQLTKRRESMISLDNDIETDIKLTRLIDMDFEINNADQKTEELSFTSGDENDMTELGQDSTDNSSFINHKDTNLISAGNIRYSRGRLSLDSLNKMVKSSGNDNINEGLRSFNLAPH